MNGDGAFNAPTSAHAMLGAGGQCTMIVPTHNLVVVRLGHYAGEVEGEASFNCALKHLVDAVPSHEID